MIIIKRENGNSIVWEDGEKESIVDRYKQGESANSIRKETGLHHTTIMKLLEEFGVEKRTRSTSRNEKLVNDCDIFDNIDSHEKAYWIGILASDGYIGDKSYMVKLSMTDSDVVYNFADFLGVDRKKVKIMKPENKNWKDVYTLSVQDKRLNYSLRKIGLISGKSLILKPPIFLKEELYYDYIRGYFDGDGGVSKNSGNKIQIYFTGTLEVCEWIMSVFKLSHLKIFPEHRSNGNNTYRIAISGKLQIFKIISKIYRNSSERTRMLRKFNFFKSYYDHSIVEATSNSQ